MTTTQRVLVAYGTKNGSTAEIAEWIADELRGQLIEADVLPAADIHDIGPYDAVVLGAGLYVGRWQRDAVRFARRHRKALTRRPVWLFSSGPLDPSATERDLPAAPAVARIATRLGPRGHATVGGRLAEGAQGLIARQILKQGEGGDFRDREQIRTWAHGVAAGLVGTTQQGLPR